MHDIAPAPSLASAKQQVRTNQPAVAVGAAGKAQIRTGQTEQQEVARAVVNTTDSYNKTLRKIGGQIPWPAVVMAIIAIVALVLVGVIPKLSLTYKLIGLGMVLLWSIVWIIALWAMWKYEMRTLAWIMLLIPILSITGYVLFLWVAK